MEEVQKKYSHNGKLNEKNSCTPINSKKYSCYGLKKIYTRNLITKKKFLRLGNSPRPPPPKKNFSNGPSLIRRTLFFLSSGGLLLSFNFFPSGGQTGRGRGARRGIQV